MSKFVQVRKGTIVNLEHVTAVRHDETGFNSIGGDKKSIAIDLDDGNQIKIMEGEPEYRRWLDFIAHIQPLSPHEGEREREI